MDYHTADMTQQHLRARAAHPFGMVSRMPLQLRAAARAWGFLASIVMAGCPARCQTWPAFRQQVCKPLQGSVFTLYGISMHGTMQGVTVTPDRNSSKTPASESCLPMQSISVQTIAMHGMCHCQCRLTCAPLIGRLGATFSPECARSALSHANMYTIFASYFLFVRVAADTTLGVQAQPSLGRILPARQFPGRLCTSSDESVAMHTCISCLCHSVQLYTAGYSSEACECQV